MQIYSFDAATGEFTVERTAVALPGREALADNDPTKFQIPAHTTTTPPPTPATGDVAVWDGIAWTTAPDHRGETWFGGVSGREPVVVSAIGDPATMGLTQTAAPPTVAALKAHAANKRWQVETGGITVGTTAVSTSETSQAKIAEALAAFERGAVTGVLKFKGADGAFVDVDQATLTAIYSAIVGHVQACYATEESVVAGINAGTITTEAEIDAAAWPSNG